MRAIVSFDEQPRVLRCSGDEDLSTRGLRTPSFLRAGRCGSSVVVELFELQFADSSFIVDLAMLARRLRRQGHEVRLRGAPPTIRQLFATAGLHQLPNLRVDWPLPSQA